jgi:hypothetical protein
MNEPISLHKHYDQPDAFEQGLIITAAHVDKLMYTGRPLISSDLVVNLMSREKKVWVQLVLTCSCNS